MKQYCFIDHIVSMDNGLFGWRYNNQMGVPISQTFNSSIDCVILKAYSIIYSLFSYCNDTFFCQFLESLIKKHVFMGIFTLTLSLIFH